jgi:serine/threonine protein kinase
MRQLLSEIAGRPPGQWATLLARRFPTDPALVQQSLLWLHADRDADPDETRPSLGEVGDDRYELQVMLDQGATASVWQAYDRKLARTVAIKILHAEGIEEVLAEARAAADVISDHVVRILDVHDGEPPYIVMELVGEHDPERGELALGRAASECKPEDVREVAAWVMRVARGVHDAHLRNVFHRDLKPRNVLITPISRKARIADFGLAVSTSSENEAGTSPLVRSGPSGPLSVHGTPEFLSPEQARGLPELDPRSAPDRAILVAIDIWGLGALMYALFANKGPWGPRGSGIAAWERATSGSPPPAIDRTTWGERIPRTLRRILDKLLALDPHERYASAAQVANELEAFLARRPTTFDRSAPPRIALWTRRNPQLATAAVVAVGLVALSIATHLRVSRLRDERDDLKQEVTTQQQELEKLNSSVEQGRGSLMRTRAQLEAGAEELRTLRASTDEERRLHETVLQAKDKDLREATAATRKLVEQLEAARAARTTVEGYWKAAQRELDRMIGERDRLREDRDAARTERDKLKRERDAAAAARDEARHALARAQHDLEAATSPKP